jgi:hypothetical protein
MDTSNRSSLSSGRGSISSISPNTITPGVESLFLVEEINSRAHLADMGAESASKGKARATMDEFGAIPSTTGMGGGGGFVAQFAQSGWNATFPRRGSLAVLSRNPLAPWAAASEFGGLGVGDKDRVMGAGQHWSERRGSWAEGWSKP